MSSYRWVARCGGLALIVLFGVLSRIGNPTERIPLFLALYGAAFIAYAVVVFILRRRRAAQTSDGDGRGGRAALVEVLIVAAVCRALLVPVAPTLSTDIYRYVWEGNAITHGFNPFRHAPDSAELAFLRDSHYDPINHKDLETIYPPLAQGVFALGAWIAPGPLAQKILFVLFDLATVLVLMALLRARGRDPAMSVVYAWNPLVIVEVAHSGHLDSVGIFFLMVGLLAMGSGRQLAGAASLAMSFLAKYTSILLVPFLVLRSRSAVGVAVAVAVVVLGYLPFASAGAKLVSSLQVYGREWYFNGFIYSALMGVWNHPDAVRLILLGALGAIVIVVALREQDIIRYAYVAIGSALLLVPTLYPWYLCWIVPFLCFHFNRAWVLLTGLVFASYWVWVDVAAGGEWLVRPTVMVLEFVPFYALLVVGALRGRARVQRRDVNPG